MVMVDVDDKVGVDDEVNVKSLYSLLLKLLQAPA